MPIEDKKIWVPVEVSGVRAKVPAGLTMRIASYCSKHPETKLICPKCIASSGGKIGGKVKSEAKTLAARANAKLPRTRKVKP